MATTAPAASTSVLERTTVMRPLPSSQRWTSPQVSEAASERRRPVSDSTATRVRSNFPRSAACSAVSKPPLTPFVVPSQFGMANGVFRAHRYGPDHPALQGKELDPDRLGNFNQLYGGR